MVNNEQVAKFLEGKHPQKYIVGIEIPYDDDKVNLIINDPEKGKIIKRDQIKSFLWFKEDVTKLMYGGKRNKITQATKKFGVKLSRLKTSLNNQSPVPRIDDGFKFMAKVDGPYSKLLNFFKQGGIDVYGKSHKHLFMAINPVEQYLIQSGKRLFKGFEDYDELHRFQFDLETTGLYPKGNLLSREEIQDVNERKNTGEDLTKSYEFDGNNEPLRHKDARIFQIGVKDNRGFEEILEIDPNNNDREEELLVILKFFEIIKKLQPDTIVGYNSENFDWHFIFTRCEILGVDIEMMAKTLDPTGKSKIGRKDRSIKYGGETEYFKQTSMFGYNILDVYHAVRRAKAINSNIKSAGLKYITKYAKKNKPNRVYVEGGKIYSIWADRETSYAFNNVDGKYYTITDKKPLEEGYEVVQGRDIVRRYLLDDLWETEKVDEEFNQAAFLLSKIIPTSYSRSTTMGTAGTWKLIMLAWSFENRLALPATIDRHTFTGGLSRLLEVGFRKNVVKLDFAALYPNIEITHDIFPNVDISGAMKSMLLYIANTRDTFKGLMNEHKGKARAIEAILIERADKLTPEQKARGEKALREHKSLAAKYDKKQLPIKILGNSFFGSLGAPNIFNWGDLECAEETTCRGRQYLRLMVKFFVDKGFTPLVGDTDGFNFAIPDNVNDFKYTPKGTHRFTEPNIDKELIGLDAVVGEFNELYMIGRMGLDIDDICETTINFSRKNYANLIDGKIKFVGNTIKSSKMPGYIEDFLEVGIEHLLNGDGHSFIQLYNKTVEEIYNFRIPLVKIASKSSVKESIATYKKDCKTVTKSGSAKARKAHMELAIRDKLKVNLGDTIYYVNTGTSKSHGDVQKKPLPTEEQKAYKKKYGKYENNGDIPYEVILNCMMIPSDQIENDPELTTSEYNVPRYLAKLNSRIKALLVCFNEEIRDDIIVDMVKNKETQEMELTPFKVFTRKQCELTNGVPLEEGQQDDYVDDLMVMEDKEIQFWIRNKKEPNNLSDLGLTWQQVKDDYNEKKRLEKIEGIKIDTKNFKDRIKRLEVEEIEEMKKTSVIPKRLTNFAHFMVKEDKTGNPNIFIISSEWGIDLGTVEDIFKYESWAIQRNEWYPTQRYKKYKTFEFWLKHLWSEAKLNSDDNKASAIEKELVLVGIELDIEDYNKIEKEKEKNGVI
tara:strand:- start:25827 stop:29336 length:3510 start_codon:yes stop_codon:yes gene_type:complete